MSLIEETQRGARAARLIADEAFRDAFDAVRNGIIERWEACPVRDKEGAHELKLMLKLLGDVKSVLEATIEDGKIASQKLDELNGRRVLTPKEWTGR